MKIYKIAKLLDPPYELIEPIYKYLLEVHNKNMDFLRHHHIRNREQQLQDINNFLKQFKKDFPLPLSNFYPNAPNISVTIEFIEDDKSKGQAEVRDFGIDNNRQYNITFNLLNIRKEAIATRLKFNVHSKTVVKHEILHLLQNHIFKGNMVDDLGRSLSGGLPKKELRTKDYSPVGFKLNEHGHVSHPIQKLDHPLIDIEFYPNANTIFNNIWNQLKQYQPEYHTNQQIKRLLKEDPILNFLKNNDINKFQRTINLVYPALIEKIEKLKKTKLKKTTDTTQPTN